MHKIFKEQFLPITLNEAWDFFSTPVNLNLITPPDMQFSITSTVPETIYEGLFISYRIAPVPWLWLNWITEITFIETGKYFIDEQRKGPYKIWHHEHHFKEMEGGVIMTDILYYSIGKNIFGWLAGKLFVHNKVNHIFTYRQVKLQELFPAKK